MATAAKDNQPGAISLNRTLGLWNLNIIGLLSGMEVYAARAAFWCSRWFF